MPSSLLQGGTRARRGRRNPKLSSHPKPRLLLPVFIRISGKRETLMAKVVRGHKSRVKRGGGTTSLEGGVHSSVELYDF